MPLSRKTNSPDATLLARANHTGTQLAATISDFSTAADARVTAAVGTTVQAYDADLTTWSGVTPGTGVGTFLATPSSANLAAAVTGETGTGALVFGTSPAITTPTGIVKGDVGLGNVDNTADTAKPVSTAQQTALNLKANLASPAFTGTPTGITATHVGLGNVDNTSNATERAATATLTNKTLTAPVINAPTGFLTGAAKITVGTTAPSSPTTGDIWLDSN